MVKFLNWKNDAMQSKRLLLAAWWVVAIGAGDEGNCFLFLQGVKGFV